MDNLLSDNDRKEQLSRAFAKAVAAKAGYSTSEPNVDRDSVDLSIHAGGMMCPSISLQLKATSGATWSGSGLSFKLKRKNYDDLRAQRLVPLILVVFDMPTDEDDWLGWSENELILRKCAWWLSIKGSDPIETEHKTVYVPRSQPFNPMTLHGLMQRVRSGEL